MRHLPTLTAMVLALGLALPAMAQNIGLDANNDTMVDRNEWRNFRDGTFSTFDSDASGIIDENEYNETDNFGFGVAEGDADTLFGRFERDD